MNTVPQDQHTLALAEKIEGRIDKEVAGALPMKGTGGAVSIAPRNVAELMEFSKMMALSGPCVRPQFRNNPGACMAISIQAFRWGMDPFAVCNKAYITTAKGGDQQISFEAQLIHAVVNERAPLQGRLRPAYDGQGGTRKCKIVGYLVGEDAPFDYESPEIGKIGVKNSPLWQSDPDQQLFYYSVRAWARRHVPEVLLGVCTEDEIRDGGTLTIDTDGTYRPPARPTRAQFEPYLFVNSDGEILHTYSTADDFAKHIEAVLKSTSDDYAAAWHANQITLDRLAHGDEGARGWYQHLANIFQDRDKAEGDEAEAAAKERAKAAEKPAQAKPAPAATQAPPKPAEAATAPAQADDGGDWPALLETLTEQLGGCATFADIDDLVERNGDQMTKAPASIGARWDMAVKKRVGEIAEGGR